MPIPRHSTALGSVQLPLVAEPGGRTEIRVHGVGGSTPDAILGDLAPEQASGDGIAGFYRSADHRASEQDKNAGRDADRHVEVYSWGGLTSRSKVRVLWLVLLPFLFGNLAGWMCSARTRGSAWRFRLHRLAAGLGALALTVNAVLVAVMISADVVAYQTARAGLARHQWWLAPLGWHFIAGHPARQVLVGVLVPVLLVLALAWLARRTWRYEAVRPPCQADPPGESRKITAAALSDGLASDDFWDGEESVRLLTHVHIAVAIGFLAIVLGVTAKALTAGATSLGWIAWIAIGLGAATVALGAGYICLDALTTRIDNAQADSTLTVKLRGWLPFLLIPAAAALIGSGVFAWLQPGGPAGQPGGRAGQAAELPGMAGVIGWTALAIAVPLAAALISVLLGISGGSGEAFFGGPWVTLMLAFSVLNTFMLGAQIWVAHLVGPVTSNAAAALGRPRGKIYLPYVITSGVPLVVSAAVVAILAFAVAELVRWLRADEIPGGMTLEYEGKAREFVAAQLPGVEGWYWSGFDPFVPAGDDPDEARAAGRGWQRTIARAQFLGGASHDADWLLWGIIVAQLAIAVCAWQFHLQPPVVLRNVAVSIAGFALPALMGFLYSAWNDPTRRRTIGVLWDVGTFWPRSYHPLSPPCYAERAVPDLQRRMWWLRANGGRVMLIAHSQGAMLATAALAQAGCRPAGDSPALVTFGSPVCKLYGWGFPAYVTKELLTERLAGLSGWRNFYYPTDPIGGPVAGRLPAARGAEVDQRLLDPAECWYLYGQAPPASQGHSGYWADPRVWDEVNRLAAGLRPAPVMAGAVRFQLRARTPRGRWLRRAPARVSRLAVSPDGAGEAVNAVAPEGGATVDGGDGKVAR